MSSHPSLLAPRQVEAFRLVMQHGSVTAAAAVLGISQPAVSRLVQNLQAQIGVVLFERQGHALVPTAEATLLQAEVERYRASIESLSRFAHSLHEHRQGHVRLAAMPALAMGWLPRLLADFVAAHPHSHLHLHGMPSHGVIDAVLGGQADLGLAAFTPGRAGAIVETYHAPAVLVVPREHALARRPSVRASELRGERLVRLEESAGFSARTDVWLSGVSHAAAVTTPLTGIACSLVAAGVGVAIVDPFSAHDHASRGLAVVPLEPALHHDVSLVVAERAGRTPAVGPLLAVLRRALDEACAEPRRSGAARRRR